MATGVFPMFQEEIHPSNFTYCIKIAIYVKPESRPPNFQGGPHHFGMTRGCIYIFKNGGVSPAAMLVDSGDIYLLSNSQLNQLGHPHRSWWRLNAIWPQQQHMAILVKPQFCARAARVKKSRFFGGNGTLQWGIRQLMGA